ncbi:MAG TPA: hypothetical protein VMB05_17905 [Solirubrobacteraceae bacterium]|nr:hypothetical protein [Solirubrobacteraceae bacterium]
MRGRERSRQACGNEHSRYSLRLLALGFVIFALAATFSAFGADRAAAAGARHKPGVTRAKPKPKPLGPSVTATVDTAHPGATIPQDFLGLSFEMSSLPQMARYSSRGNLVALLRSLGTGVLRFGGVSADTRIAWTDSRTPRPAWASGVVDADDFRQLASLAAESGWHIVLTLGIVHFEPKAAAREAAAAKAALGPWLQAFELGNEPNSYAMHAMREEPWGLDQYNAQVAEYRAAIEAVAPGVPLWGPDVSGSSAFETWGTGEVVDQHPSVLTGHHYPLGCAQKKPVPSVASLLSGPIWRREVGSMRRYVSLSQSAGLPFRMDETNSVSCGGVAGISNTFASALWAAGYLPKLMGSGAVGVNMHGAVGNCKGYSPICAPGPLELSTGELVAQPEWYALLMVRELIGMRPLPLAAKLRDTTANVHVAGFLAGDGSLRILAVDDDPLGKPGVSLRLKLGSGYPNASTLALTGQSLKALTGTELGESEVEANGTWAPRRFGRAASSGGVISVKLAAASAVLVSVAPPAA